jgi:hypothetical protein
MLLCGVSGNSGQAFPLVRLWFAKTVRAALRNSPMLVDQEV